MTVVRLAQDRRYGELTPAVQARMLVVVVSGLRMLGEPCTVEELTLYAQHRFPRALHPRLREDVEAILHTYAEPGPTPLADCIPFRRVQVREQEACAFNLSFRDALAESGLEIRVRDLAN